MNYFTDTIGHIRILGIGLELACNWAHAEESHEMRLMSFVFEKTPHISLSCKLVLALRMRVYGTFFNCYLYLQLTETGTNYL